MDHDSQGYYETRVRHQHEAFLNFTDSGCRVGHAQVTASAEMYWDNCLFYNCGKGLAYLEFNDYDNTIAGCEFYDCGYGIYSSRGNVYVRECHFERSLVADALVNPHSHSFSRCTSINSAQFVVTDGPSSNSCELTIQDCQVRGWTSTAGAVVMKHRGPTLVFDTTFTTPAEQPAANSDRQRELVPRHGHLQQQQGAGLHQHVRPGRKCACYPAARRGAGAEPGASGAALPQEQRRHPGPRL